MATPQQPIHFKGTEAQQYLKPGELKELLSAADHAVLRAATQSGRRLSRRGLELKTGYSAVAVILAVYRLVGLGLLAETGKSRPMPKRVDHAGSRPHQK